jgi:CRISPR-associated exonuclease Cas4
MFTDDQLIPLSALQHFLFCNRRAALVHLEGLWSENEFTVEGRHLHERADDSKQSQTRKELRIERGLELRSYEWGLVGKADVVEFRKVDDVIPLEVTIVEYKRGKPRKKLDRPFHTQVCAQALCLEEMLGYPVKQAFIYFGKARMRQEVPLAESLREQTIKVIAELRGVLQSLKTPKAKYEPRKCQKCSLFSLCVPQAMRPRATAQRYLQELIES